MRRPSSRFSHVEPLPARREAISSQSAWGCPASGTTSRPPSTNLCGRNSTENVRGITALRRAEIRSAGSHEASSCHLPRCVVYSQPGVNHSGCPLMRLAHHARHATTAHAPEQRLNEPLPLLVASSAGERARRASRQAGRRAIRRARGARPTSDRSRSRPSAVRRTRGRPRVGARSTLPQRRTRAARAEHESPRRRPTPLRRRRRAPTHRTYAPTPAPHAAGSLRDAQRLLPQRVEQPWPAVPLRLP